MESKDLFLDKYQSLDERLLKDRILLEGKITGCLWNNPDLYDDYKDLTKESFISKDGRYFYTLGKRMADKGYESLDEVTVLTYIEENSSLKPRFEEKGGYENIHTIMKLINVKNVNTYIDDVFKANTIIDLYREGFNIFNEIEIEEGDKTKKVIPFELFKTMSSAEVSDWYDWRVQSITMQNSMGDVKIVDLDLDDKFIESCDSGEEMGLPYDILGEDIDGKVIYGGRNLSDATLGIHRGDCEIIGAHSGKGKSSFVLEERVMPICYRGEKVCIMANEMNINKYKSILLSMVLSHHLKYYGITRRHLKKGGFNDEQKQMIKKAQKYYKEHYYGKIKFVELDTYGMKPAQRVIKRLARQGVNYYIYDTFKAENMAMDNTRGTLIENSKLLFQLSKKYNVGVTIVMQLAIHTENVRYLTSGCLSEAKGVKEVISELILFRDLWADEYNDEKYDVKPFKVSYIPNKEGKLDKLVEEIQLNKEKKYKIVFLDKTRNDKDSQCLLYEFTGDWNRWSEIGYCKPSHVDSRAK